MKVALIGAGHIVSVHGPAIAALDGIEIIAICDFDEQRAKTVAGRLNVQAIFSDPKEMLEQCSPDAVHILTPPATHCELSLLAIQHGCHVYVEKPMALTESEAREMLGAAKKNGVTCCANHNMVYDPMTRRVLNYVENGDIGNVVSVEAHFRFDTNRYPATKAEGAEFAHWIYGLYGGPLEDLTPHPASLIAEFISDIDEIKTVIHESGVLPPGWPDEVRALVRSGGVMAYLNISLHERPDSTSLTVVGDKGSITANFYSGIITREHKSVMPRFVSRAMAGFKAAVQNFIGATVNMVAVVLGKFDKSGGTATLIGAFYRAIRNQDESPITSDKLLNTVILTNAIWPSPCVGFDRVQRTLREVKIAGGRPDFKPDILVTGSSGFVGSHLVRKLVSDGYSVRALVRPNSINGGRFVGSEVEVFRGDLTDQKAMLEACEGIDTIYHAGSAMSGNWQTFEEVTIEGTRNILEAAEKSGARRLVHLSTLAVYELLDKSRDEVVLESDRYQRNPRKMGAYAYCKIEAEKLVKTAHDNTDLETVIVRPGMLIGEHGYPFFPHLGFNLGDKVFLLIGKGNIALPFTYVDNAVSGIILAGTSEHARGGIYNLVDNGSVTARQYIEAFVATAGVDARIVELPYIVPYLAMAAYEFGAKLGVLEKGKTSRAQLKWKQAPVTYSTEKAKTELGWAPEVGIEDAISRTFKWYAKK